MTEDPACYSRLIDSGNFDLVMHTAAPFFEETSINNNSQVLAKIKNYRDATKYLARSAVRTAVPKVVMTGAASSVIGSNPLKENTEENSHYDDPTHWVD